MNILQINTRYIGGGGAANIANGIHKYINNNTNNKSTFLFGRGKASNSDNASKISNGINVIISVFATRLLGEQFNVYNNEIDKYIDEADVIHIHNLHGYYINYEELINKIIEKDKKVIITLHDMWLITGRCGYAFQCDKWMNKCGNCINKDIYPKTFIDKSRQLVEKKQNIFLKLNPDKTILVTPSIWLKKQLEETYLSKFNIKVISNGVEDIYIEDDKYMIRKKLGFDNNKKYILFVAADLNNKWKGIDYILDIIDRVDDDIRFVSVGKNIKFNNDKLIQLGYISDKKCLYSIYKACDLYINTSLGETFSLTTVEAQANGLPALAFELGPLKDIIDIGVNGDLVQIKNRDELVKSINRLLSNKIDLRIMSDNARKKFEENYRIENMHKSYEELYKLINEKE